MKKISLASLFLVGLMAHPFAAGAADSKSPALEISGNVDTVLGWQHDDSHALGTAIGGQLGPFRGATSGKRDTFNFYLDQVELDLNKSLGENIRIRADIDFGRTLSGSGRNTDTGGTGSSVELEQGYVTANLWGTELMVGRFNIPIGYYVVDRADNPTISFSNAFNYLTPTNGTGAKIYKSFGSNFDWHLYVINNLADSVPFGFASISGTTPNPGGLNHNSALPSYGTRIGFNWGEENTKSTIGLSYAGGPERDGCHPDSGCNRHLTHIADLDFAVKVTPKFLVAGEGVYRQDNSITHGVLNDKALGGFLVLNYDLDDAWRVFFRYGFMQDRTGFYTDAATTVGGVSMHDFALGAGYQIAEGAKMKLEYSPTIFDPRVAGLKTSWSHAFALEFAYNF